VSHKHELTKQKLLKKQF